MPEVEDDSLVARLPSSDCEGSERCYQRRRRARKVSYGRPSSLLPDSPPFHYFPPSEEPGPA